jgi:hypothetical protein
MRNKIKLLALVCTALTALLAASPAFAQDGDGGGNESGDNAKPSWVNAWFNLKMPEHPWYFGISGGWTYNTLYMGGAENYRPTQKWEGANGWTIALSARYQIFNWLAVQAEPSYIAKNYAFKWTGRLEGQAYDNITNGFVELPLLANFSAGWGAGSGRIRVFANAGVFIGVWAHSRGQGVEPSQGNTYWLYGTSDSFFTYDTAIEFDERRDNRFDGGLLFGAGVQYDIKAFSVFAECRYSYSLSDLQKKYQTVDFVPQMNDTWIVQVGVLFNPGIYFGEKNIFLEETKRNENQN